MAADNQEPLPHRLALGVGICVIAYLFFATASSLVWNFRGKFPTVQILFIQTCVSLLCVLPLSLRKGLKRLKTDHLSVHLMRDLFGIGSYYLYFLAIRDLNLVDATTLNYTAPFFVPIVWWIWMKQKVDPHVWWSIIIGFLGVALILNPTHQIFQLGFIYGLFAGIASSVSFCAIRILNLHKEPMSRTLFYYFSIGILITFPFALVSWVHPTPTEWIQAICVGIATAIAQILLTVAYRYGTASYLSPLGYTSVIYAGLSFWLIFGNPLTLRSIIGAAMIIVGGVMTFLLKKKSEGIIQALQTPDHKDVPPL
ncbi:MAG: DMT family transporter [Chlamydiia bacterium]|nr:DMT family transporter [Chlamydiia bacterium]